MAYELRDGQGSLFLNDKKETEKHPDYKGSMLIEGQKYWLSGWSKKGERGKWLSLAATPAGADKAPPKKAAIDDDSIDF